MDRYPIWVICFLKVTATFWSPNCIIDILSCQQGSCCSVAQQWYSDCSVTICSWLQCYRTHHTRGGSNVWGCMYPRPRLALLRCRTSSCPCLFLLRVVLCVSSSGPTPLASFATPCLECPESPSPSNTNPMSVTCFWWTKWHPIIFGKIHWMYFSFIHKELFLHYSYECFIVSISV